MCIFTYAGLLICKYRWAWPWLCPLNVNYWLMDAFVPAFAEVWEQPFLKYDFSGLSWYPSLSPSHSWLLGFTVWFLYISFWGFQVVDAIVCWEISESNLPFHKRLWKPEIILAQFDKISLFQILRIWTQEIQRTNSEDKEKKNKNKSHKTIYVIPNSSHFKQAGSS